MMTIIQKVIERVLEEATTNICHETKPARAGGVLVPAADCFATDAIIAAKRKKKQTLVLSRLKPHYV